MTQEGASPGAASVPPPLLLCSVKIARFRSLYEVGPLPIQAGLTVLTGENDGGKSAFIDAVSFLLNARPPDSGDRCSWCVGEEPIEVVGSFCEIGDPERKVVCSIRAICEKQGGTRREVLDCVHSGLGARPEDLSFNDLRAKMNSLSIRQPGGREKAPYVQTANVWLSQRPSSEFVDQWRPLSAEESKRLPSFTAFSSAGAPNPVDTVHTVISRESRRKLLEDSYKGSLADIGAALDKDVAPSLEHLKAKIREHCTDLDSVDIHALFDFTKPSLRVDLLVWRQGKSLDLGKAGEGRRRRITLAIHEASLRSMEVEAPTSSDFLAYDEPDTHLDYACQRTLFDILDRQSRLPHVQVLVATHSLNFIDKVPLQSILHFRLDEELKTSVEVLSSGSQAAEQDFLSSICAGLGLRNSILLDERCFLVIEGDTEAACLPAMFRSRFGRSLIAAGITLVNTGGSGAAHKVVRIMGTEWKRSVVLLVDTDSKKEHGGPIDEDYLSSVGLSDGYGAYFIGSKEFEDEFPDEIWLRALRAGFKPVDGKGEFQLDEVSASRSQDKFSESLCNLVKRRCKDARISKPDLGFALAAVCNPEELPTLLIDCLEHAYALARDGKRPIVVDKRRAKADMVAVSLESAV